MEVNVYVSTTRSTAWGVSVNNYRRRDLWDVVVCGLCVCSEIVGGLSGYAPCVLVYLVLGRRPTVCECDVDSLLL